MKRVALDSQKIWEARERERREASGVARDGNLLLSSSASANPPASLQWLGKGRASVGCGWGLPRVEREGNGWRMASRGAMGSVQGVLSARDGSVYGTL
jgi:hypothetical protein